MPQCSKGLSPGAGLLTASILIGIVLRISFLTHQSLWFDEVASIRMAQSGDLFRSDFHPPLYFSLLHGWIAVLGSSEFVVRLLSALIGIVSLIVIGVAAKELQSGRAAVIAVLLASLSFSHLWYSQEVRSYILLFLESAALLEIYRRWIFHPQSRGLTVALICINSALLYTHYGAALLLFAQGCHSTWLAFLRRYQQSHSKSYIVQYSLVVAGTILLSLPLLPLIITQSHHVANGRLWLPPPALVDLYLLFPRLLFHTPGVLGRIPILAINGFLAIALVSPVLLRKGLDHLHFYILIPPALALLLSVFGVQMFAPKVLISILPAVILACSGILSRIPVTAALSICLAYTTAQGLLVYRYYTTPQKEGWRSIATFLSAHAQPIDTFYFTAPGTRLALEYYYPITDDKIQNSLDKPAHNHGTVWIIYALTPEPWNNVMAQASSRGCAGTVQTRAAGVRIAGCKFGGSVVAGNGSL
jgi:uncharacterized membrane protein